MPSKQPLLWLNCKVFSVNTFSEYLKELELCMKNENTCHNTFCIFCGIKNCLPIYPFSQIAMPVIMLKDLNSLKEIFVLKTFI